MKKIVFCLLIILLFYQSALAHPGRLDKNGGHRKTADGTYHYHLGTDRSVEFENPPTGDEVIPTPTPKATKTPTSSPKPSSNKAPETTKDSEANQSPQPVFETTGSNVSPSPTPEATASEALPIYDTTVQQVEPVSLPVSKSVFIIIFSIAGILVFSVISFLIYLLDKQA